MRLYHQDARLEHIETMRCKEVELFIPLFVAGGQGMTLDERIALSSHVRSCPSCAKKYAETGFIMELIRSHRHTLTRRGIFSETLATGIRKELTYEEGLGEFQEKLKRYTARKYCNARAKQIKIFLGWSYAATIFIAIGIYFWWSSFSFERTITTPCQQLAAITPISPITFPFTVELLSDNGETVIPTSWEIETSTGETKTLLINSRHQVIVYPNTSLTLAPLLENSQPNYCLIELDSGEIQAHCEHGNDSLVIVTPHVQATTAGTTFYVKSSDDGTTVVAGQSTLAPESEQRDIYVHRGLTDKPLIHSSHSKEVRYSLAKLTAGATSNVDER